MHRGEIRMTADNSTELPGADLLVVDDTVDNLKLLLDILTRAGYRARPASNGELALRSVRAKQPALVLLDIMMPDMDGFEVCRRLKADAQTRDIPVIFLSGLTDTADKSTGFSLGGVDYITKPFHAEEVLARVRAHLALAAARDQLRIKNLQLQQANEQLSAEIEQRKRSEQMREQLMRQLESLSARLAAAQEEERRRIAYELNEELAQELAALKLYLPMIGTGNGDARSKGPRDAALSVVAHASQRVHKLVLNLEPPELAMFGLGAAVRTYSEQQAETGGWVLHLDAPKPGARAPRAVERACFRMLQEGLSNVLSHAKASEVWVELHRDDKQLELVLRDNGIGFDRNAAGNEDTPGGGLGLFGMQLRARQAGGSVEIESTPGAGTVVRAVFPLTGAPG